MFCAKCGKELGENEKFCSACGTMAGSSGNSVNQQFSTAGISANMKTAVSELGKSTVFYFVNLGLVFLSFIFLLFNPFTYRSGVTIGMFGGSVFVKVMFILFHLAVLVVLLLPMFIGKKWKYYYILPSSVFSLFSLLWLISSYSFLHSSIGMLGSVLLSISGWLYVLLTLGALVLSILTILYMTNVLGKKTSAVNAPTESVNQ